MPETANQEGDGRRIGGDRINVGIVNVCLCGTPTGRRDNGRYNINVSGWKADLAGADNPLQMCVSIGDDFGCAEKNGRIR